ncbi:RNA-binding transcriptional accessory protein [Ruminococcaceae bacterium OttesenSCG-928-A16]|nr:RNA-binding transcriptional accessory protein [Ruminococcaceae bacterium OttesenSCG-928-A16]
MDFVQILAKEFTLQPGNVKAAVELIDEGNTIPFIARYRKEATGSMDDQVLRELDERLRYLRNLDTRKTEVAATIEEQGKMTDEITAALEAARTLAEVEDIYRPYKPKRKTRGSMARARGLEPLAQRLLQQNTGDDPLALAAEYVDAEKEVADAEAALAGARDVLAEDFSDDAKLRAALRRFYADTALIESKAAKEEDGVYSGYYEFSEPVKKIAGHRILAVNRGEAEEFLKVAVTVDAEKALAILEKAVVKNSSLAGQQVAEAAADSYSRLLHPSLEREVRADLTDKADEGAIKVFGQNLRQLLLQPPIRGKVAMGLDPGYRMGCKVAVVDPTGRVLDTAVVYPVAASDAKIAEAQKIIKALIKKHKVEVIAIGNGTAGRETEMFTVDVLRELAAEQVQVEYMVVNEAGASVYSASKLAAEEFPQFDVNLRSAVSIARRMQDPLAELVKIDPKAVGVGQYQHDMPPARLAAELDGVVEACVNTVGVELNTASAPLLQRVAGLSAATAKNIVAKREEEGPFTTRKQLLKVPKLGPKAFEQCAGFLRLPDAKNKLDATAVHPESYAAAEQLLKICGFTTSDIGTEAIAALPQKAKEIGMDNLAEKLGVGRPTLQDILDELLRPGRDIRDTLPPPLLRSDVLEMKDLTPGMELVGTVRNVIDFGAFVDIGVHQDGLVHISQISNKYIRHPGEVLAVGDIVTVWVIAVDEAKKRISLTMKKPAQGAGSTKK